MLSTPENRREKEFKIAGAQAKQERRTKCFLGNFSKTTTHDQPELLARQLELHLPFLASQQLQHNPHKLLSSSA